jgi:hypothetical protein
MKNLVCELTIREVPVPPEKVREWHAGLRSLMELLVEADRKRRKQAESSIEMRDERNGDGAAALVGGASQGEDGNAPATVNSVAREVAVV